MSITDIAEPRGAPARSRANTRRRLIAAGTDLLARRGQLDPALAARGRAAMWTRVVAWWLEDPARAPRAHVARTLVELHPFSRR